MTPTWTYVLIWAAFGVVFLVAARVVLVQPILQALRHLQ